VNGVTFREPACIVYSPTAAAIDAGSTLAQPSALLSVLLRCAATHLCVRAGPSCCCMCCTGQMEYASKQLLCAVHMSGGPSAPGGLLAGLDEMSTRYWAESAAGKPGALPRCHGDKHLG
jgi:hypothetical protein